MAAKISKDELAVILKNIANKGNYDDMQEEIEKTADEYGIDLTEVEEEEDVVLEEVGDLLDDTDDLNFFSDDEQDDF